MAVTYSPPKVKTLGPQPNTGGTPPTGNRAASEALKRRESGRHYTLRTRREAAESKARSGGRGRAPAPPPKPYDALESPYKTQAQFNSAVSANARTQYQPELDTLNTEQQGEAGLHQQREGENAKTYDEYSKQAQDAFERAKAAMAEIAARQNSSTDAGQKALQAALSNTGVAGLAGVANPDAFMKQAAGLGNMQSQVLAGQQSGTTGELSKNLLVPGAGRAEAQFKEQQRTGGALGKIAKERRQVLARVPDIMSKTRADMSKEETAREAQRQQVKLAGGKLGLEKTTQAQTNRTNQQKLAQERAIARESNAAKLQESAESVGIKWSEIDIQRKDLANKILEAGNARSKAAAEVAAKRYDKGLEIMTHNLAKNDKTEFQPTGNPQVDKEAEESGKRRPYKRDAMGIYNQLTKQAFLSAPEAFNVMESSGNGYVEQFAKEHRFDYESKERLRHHNPPAATHSPAHTGRGGLRGH